MQTFNASPRQAFTVAQVTALLRDAPSLTIDKGLEVVNRSLNVVSNISSSLADGTVSRNAYADVHASCRLAVSTELDWGRDIVRPYMLTIDPNTGVSMRWNLGAYYLSIPNRGVRDNPPTYDLTGFDIISGLKTSVGESYSVDTGESYLDAAVAIAVAQGYTEMIVDQANQALTLATPKVWAIGGNITWLTIINELLGAIGYQGLWSDWDGRLRFAQYAAPSTRASEFTYDAGEFSSMMADDLEQTEDYFATANKWVFVRQNADADDTPPSEGAGIYTFVNQSNGKTSVDARGRIITAEPVFVDAANQDALIARAEQTIAADMRTSARIKVTGPPMPAHWHFDRLLCNDPRLGPPIDVVSTQWSLPLSGADMTHEWAVV